MKVKNGYLIKEENDVRDMFGYLDEKIKYPNHIEKLILEVLLEQLSIKYKKNGYELDDMFSYIPTEYIRNWVEVINTLYYEEKKVNYDGIENAYLIYYLPINTFKIHKLLRDLILKNLIPINASILDIGCGPGSATIGVLEFYRRIAIKEKDIQFNLSITLLDAVDSFIDIAENCIEKMIKILPNNINVTIHKSIVCKIDKNFKLEYMYDFIIISNLLNGAELNKEFGVHNFFNEVITSTDEDGAILIIEPGEEKQCERLKKIRNKVLEEFKQINIYSPCNDLWNAKEAYTCKCFTVANVRWKKPFLLEKLIENGLVKNLNKVAFNYLILRKDKKTKYGDRSSKIEYTPIKELASNIDEIINVKGIVRCVNETPNYTLVSICDGSDNMNNEKHANLCIKNTDVNLVNRYKNVLTNMNVGEMIKAEQVRCEKMWKYPNSYLLHITNESKIQFLY